MLSQHAFKTHPRKMTSKDLDVLKPLLPHLRKVQQVDRTWNFAHSTLCKALDDLAEAACFIPAPSTPILKPYSPKP